MPNSIKIKDLWNGEWWLDLFLCRMYIDATFKSQPAEIVDATAVSLSQSTD